jgi:hypothetical protein
MMKNSTQFKKLLIYAIVCIVCLPVKILIAQTDVAGGNVSGSWLKMNSPYQINGEITIPDASTLSIEPGVQVIFTGHYKLNVRRRFHHFYC